MKLTQRAVEALALPTGKQDAIYFDDALPGFGVRLRAGGSKIYVVQYKIGGQGRRITLGTTALLKAEQARATAVELLAKVKLGSDPAHDKAAAQAQAGETFAAVVRLYLARQRARLRPSSYSSEERYLLGHFRALHGLPLARLDRRTIATCLGTIAADRGPGAADRARATLSGFLAWAMREGMVETNPVLATNTHATGKARDRVLRTKSWSRCGRPRATMLMAPW
jgi:Arm DNA-binding domain